jgi:hypothetical protein
VIRRVDPLPLAAAVLTLMVVFLYLVLVAQTGGEPTRWAVATLTVAASGALYAAWRTSRLRRTVLWPCAIVLFLMGWLTITSIGLPLMLAAGLCIAAALRIRTRRDWRDLV